MKQLLFVAVATMLLLSNSTYATTPNHPLTEKITKTPIFDVTLPSLSQQNTENHWPLIHNGWFVDGLVGAHGHGHHGHWHGHRPATISIGGRVGHKWYLGNVKKWRFGIQGTFARLGLSFGLPTGNGNKISNSMDMHFAPTVGFINGFQFTEEVGLEANANVGFNLLVTVLSHADGEYREDAVIVRPGFMFNPAVKFRYKKLAVGVDVAMIYAGPGTYRVVDSNGNEWTDNAGASVFSIISLTIGKVF